MYPETHRASYSLLAPLLVQRCNSTTAGLGYLEESVDCPCKSPLGRLAVSAQSTPIGGNNTIPLLTFFDLNHNLVNTSQRQTSIKPISSPHHYARNPPSKLNVKIMCSYQYKYILNKFKKSSIGH
jgi:hypothetical protein